MIDGGGQDDTRVIPPRTRAEVIFGSVRETLLSVIYTMVTKPNPFCIALLLVVSPL